jgi:hypothetical protein
MSVWGKSEKGLVISCFDGKDAKRVDDFFFRLVSVSCSPNPQSVHERVRILCDCNSETQKYVMNTSTTWVYALVYNG